MDWIYREVDRVHTSWLSAQRGQVDFHTQVGHPLGFPGFAYAGEIALADPTGELGALHAHAERWLVNEKGAVTAAGALPGAPPGFGRRAHHLLGHLGATPARLRASLTAAEALVADVHAATAQKSAAPQMP